jgi:error-prone DNA polymerase
MATLPRLRPKTFYDLVVEVALIRPGPIQGGSVHPYLRRRSGEEAVSYLHPLLRPALEKTLGVPLFQEQLMQIAIDVAGFSAADADELRQAMGSKRSSERMERLRGRLYAGMAARGVTGEIADAVYAQLAAFANFGFPESHSVSFAYLVYASSWIKLHYPAAFLAGLLNSQPMGFWSPQSLVADARRHGVVARRPDVNRSAALATLEPLGEPAGGVAVRLGLAGVRGIGEELAGRIVEAREAAGGCFTSIERLVRACGPNRSQLESLATAGAFGDLAPSRRAALWAAGALAGEGPGRLPGTAVGAVAPRLPSMSPLEEHAADLWATGVTTGGYPLEHIRPALAERGVFTAAALVAGEGEEGGRILVAGVVTHRQRPATAAGTIFLNLEDETGVLNVICSKGCWTRYRRVALGAPALVVQGRLERNAEAVSIVAERIERLELPLAVGRSRDFR